MIRCWRVIDRKIVTFLSTEHDVGLLDTGNVNPRTKEPIIKPKVMHEYNKHMGGVDPNDQLAKYSAFNRRTCKWWKKVFFRLLNLSMVNAYVLFREWKKSTGKDVKNLRQVNFRKKVIRSIIDEKLKKKVNNRRSLEHRRLIDTHFPSPLLSEATQRKIQRHCVVCNPAERALLARNGDSQRWSRENDYIPMREM